MLAVAVAFARTGIAAARSTLSGTGTKEFVHGHAGGPPQRKADGGNQPQGYVRPIDIADSG
ncbi:hypothetical protein GCM10020255_002520 [Rhodococcus baikonurensis]